MISHRFVKDVIQLSIGNVNFSSEDLVQMDSQLVSDTSLIKTMLKVMVVECPIHVVDVIVKVTTHNDSSIGVLTNDILDDISHSFCSLHFEGFAPRFEVAIQYLHLLLPSCHPRPAEIGSQRFDKR